MSWMKVDDRFWCHQKVERLEVEFGAATHAQAVALWTIAGSWSAQNGARRLTLPTLRRLVPWSPVRAAKALEAVGLWDAVEGGWAFHNWSKYRRGGGGEPGNNPEETPEQSDSNRGTTGKQLSKNPIVRPAESFNKTDPPLPLPLPDPSYSEVVVDLRAGMEGAAAGSTTPATTPNRTEPGASLAGGPSGPTETELAAVASALARAWSDAWLAHTAGPAAPAQLAQVRTLAPWLVEYARRRPEAAIDLASPLVEAFFDARVKHARPRVEWLLEDPGNFLEKTLAAAVTEDRSYATYLAEYARNPVRAGDPH